MGGTSVSVALNGTTTNHTVSQIQGYGSTTNKGLSYNGTIIAGSGDAVSLNLTYEGTVGTGTVNYTATPTATISGSASPYTLTMPVGNTTINATVSFTKTINAYNNSGYYFVASPLAQTVTPASVGMITDNLGNTIQEGQTATYDLYKFDQTQELEWRNYRASTFDLMNGQGYLYASSTNITLVFTGSAYSGDGEVELTYSTSNPDANMRGWNLVGNPFAETAYINMAFYTLDGGLEYVPKNAGAAIEAMQGVLVHTDAAGTLTFSTTAPSKNANLTLNVTQGRSVIDRAIVRFSEGSQLPKLQFRNGSTKVYMPVEGKDYAVANAENQGTMPVNFKAEKNGTYTLSFTTEEVSFAYLHLIDNMTGNDVDLLAGASTGSATYTFNAKTTDYESRFKLVYATGDNSNDDNFAFYTNGSFVINNEGEATLQVIDINGRILKSESINGCANVNVKAAAGVYMLRLVNGNDVKVQKVVVR